VPDEDEFREALAKIEAEQPELIQPTDEELRNGWTPEALTAYLHEQKAAQALRIDPMSSLNRRSRRPTQANNVYRPQRWRG
jgi:hypothetical protein